MDILGIDKALAGLKRGAEKFGTRVAAAVVKRVRTRTNAINGFSPNEPEPYGAGMGGADTEQESRVPTQALNAHEHEDLSFPCDVCGKTMCPSCGGTSDAGATYHTKDCKAKLRQQLKDAGATGSAARLNAFKCPDCGSTDASEKVGVLPVHCPGCGEHMTGMAPRRCSKCGWDSDKAGITSGPQFAKKNAAGQGWDVFLKGEKIDTVFYDDGLDADYVKRGLVGHDGYDPDIEVRKSAHKNDGIDSSALGYQSAQRTTTAVRGKEQLENASYANMWRDAPLAWKQDLLDNNDMDASKAGDPFDSFPADVQRDLRVALAMEFENSRKNDGPLLSRCPACGLDSQEEWAGKCAGCGTENEKDAGGNTAVKENAEYTLKCSECGGAMSSDWQEIPAGNGRVRAVCGMCWSKLGKPTPSRDRDEEAEAHMRRWGFTVKNKENSIRKNSYGNVNIDGDIKRGLTDEQIASKISERYPRIDKNQALRIASQVRKGGPDASADWGDESSDIMASSKDNAKLPFDMSCDSCGKKLVQESQVAQCEKCDANLCGACRERVAGDTYCEKCAEDARQNTSAKENAVKFRVESLDDGRWEVAFGSGRAGEIFEDKKEAERRALELNDGRKNAGQFPGDLDMKPGQKVTIDANETEWHGMPGVVVSSDARNVRVKLQSGETQDFKYSELMKNAIKENAGHMGPDSWIAASLDERCAWLESAGLDINLATLRFQDLSEDAHVALQDRMDMPASRNNLGALAAGAERGAASVESTGEDLPGPVSMGGGALGNASGPTKCSWCDGTGMGPCPECEGEYATSKDCICKGTGHTKCADCKGTGKIENASGPTKIFSFKDANGEVETVAAESEQEAWQKLSRDFGTSIEDIHGMGIKLVSVRENSKAQEPCSACGLPKQMRPVGGDENSFVCGNRQCSSFKNDDEKKNSKADDAYRNLQQKKKELQKIVDEIGRTAGRSEMHDESIKMDLLPEKNSLEKEVTQAYLTWTSADREESAKSKTNSDEAGDLEEIARHAEGIEHEVDEMLEEGMENRSIPESKIGEEISHHIRDKGMEPDQAIAAAYSETRNSGVSRGQGKYGTRKNYNTEDQKDELDAQVHDGIRQLGKGQESAKKLAGQILRDAKGDLKAYILAHIGNEFDLQHWIENR